MGARDCGGRSRIEEMNVEGERKGRKRLCDVGYENTGWGSTKVKEVYVCSGRENRVGAVISEG